MRDGKRSRGEDPKEGGGMISNNSWELHGQEKQSGGLLATSSSGGTQPRYKYRYLFKYTYNAIYLSLFDFFLQIITFQITFLPKMDECNVYKTSLRPGI